MNSGQRYNVYVPEWWFLQTGLLMELLRHVIPEEESLKRRVGILGSAALCLLQESRRVGPVWSVSGREARMGVTTVTPGDYDVFVTGKNGRRGKDFLVFVDGCVEKMEALGYTVKGKGGHFVPYARGSRRMWIANRFVE